MNLNDIKIKEIYNQLFPGITNPCECMSMPLYFHSKLQPLKPIIKKYVEGEVTNSSLKLFTLEDIFMEFNWDFSNPKLVIILRYEIPFWFVGSNPNADDVSNLKEIQKLREDLIHQPFIITFGINNTIFLKCCLPQLIRASRVRYQEVMDQLRLICTRNNYSRSTIDNFINHFKHNAYRNS